MFKLLPAGLVGAVLLAGCGLPGAGAPSPGPSGSPAGANQALGAQTDRRIASAQATLRVAPHNVAALNELSAAYLQKVREVGDPSYYPKVDDLLVDALRLDPPNINSNLLLGLLELARHQFKSALDQGAKVVALAPHSSGPYGVLGDAQVELGRYTDAQATFQTMVNTRPDLGSYSRVSYIRELFGDIPGAIDAMQRALAAGGPFPENTAYVQVLLGNLYFNSGHLDEADAQYQEVLSGYPDYVHAVAASAAVRAARADYKGAIALYQKAIGIYPLPQYVVALGDVYTASGNAAMATQTYALADAEQALYKANGVDLDQELALFDADHQRNLADALVSARRAAADRPSVQSSDVLAWTLYATGDYASALVATRQSHRINTQDASFFFHSGMIEARLHMNADARADLQKAIDINPHFSLLRAPEARATLAALPS